jgi:hypothetical protein
MTPKVIGMKGGGVKSVCPFCVTTVKRNYNIFGFIVFLLVVYVVLRIINQ